MKHLFGLVLRYIKGQRGRSALTVAGLALAVALVSATSIFGASLTASYLDYVISINGSWHATFLELTGDQVAILTSHAQVERAGKIRFLGQANVKDGVAIVGAEYDPTALELKNLRLAEGEFPKTAGGIALEQWVLAEMGLGETLGQEIFLSFGAGPEAAYTLTGILVNQAWSQYNGYADAVVGGGATGGYQVVAQFKEQYRDHKTAQEIQVQLGLEPSQVRVNESLFLALSDNSQQIIYLFLGLAVLVATVAAIHNIMHISVLERIQQYGMLRALGTGPRQIRRIVLGEGLVLGAIAIPLGLVTGVVGTWGLVKLLSASFVGEITRVVVPYWTILWACTVCLAAILLSAWRPALIAGRVSPVEAMGGTASVIRERDVPVRRWQSSLGRFFGVNSVVAWRNLQRHRGQFRITVFSLSTCVSLIIVFAFFVGAAQPELVLKNQFPGEYLLSIDGTNQFAGYTDEDLAVIQKLDGVQELFWTRERTANILITSEQLSEDFRKYLKDNFGQTMPETGQYSMGTVLYAYSANIMKEADNQLVAGCIDLERMSAHREVLIVNNLPSGLQVSKLQVGDEIMLRTARYEGNEIQYGPEQAVRIAGVLKGKPHPAEMVAIGLGVVMHEDTLTEFLGSTVYRRVDIKVGEDGKRDYIKAVLKGIAEIVPQGKLVSFQEQVRQMEEQKRQFSILLFSLIAVIVLISLFSIVNTISTNLLLRTREFGVLRAVGMTKNQLLATIRAEGLYYGLTSSVWGAAVGNLLTWMIYVAARNQATWLEWALPWPITLLTCAGAVSFSLLATIAPRRRISELDVVDVLRRVY